MIKDNVATLGNLVVELRDQYGNLKDSRKVHNLVVATGLAYLSSRSIGVASNVMSHMAVGSGNTAPAAANAALGTELGRTALSSANISTTTTANDAVTYVATFGAGIATGAVTEAGLFNAVSAGTMLSRTVFAVVNKGALDTLTITWKVTLA